MDVSPILDPLNDAQRDAVTAAPGHMLVLAGAGSGKTRVLVHRIAWLLATEQATPYRVLAVTFTNKAAGEMRTRIEAMLEHPVGAMWVGTFHGLAHRLLRAHWREAGLVEGFQILDSDDQLRCVRRVLRDLDLDENQWPAKQAQGYINARKDEGLRPQHVEDKGDFWLTQMIRIYRAYEETCARSGIVDFAELLLRAHELLREREDILAHYRHRFAHILVDEFQDTNAIQYAWLRLLAGNSGLVFAVGDDDQSIYGWRGARIEHIQQLPKDFPDVRTVRLEQNYRSSGNILAAANALIANNQGRLGKNLWTDDGEGAPLALYTAFNELDEARFVVGRIQQWIESGESRNDVAILYRVSAQSRAFEEALLAASMPYRVHGGLRFYERAEIKDALAYLRLIANRDDDGAFERVVNMPARGVGARTMDALREAARAAGESLWRTAARLIEEKALPARAASALGGFRELIEDLAGETRELPLEERTGIVIERSGLLAHYERDKVDRAQTRVENLHELVTAARHFVQEEVEDEQQSQDPLTAFLAHAALEAGDEQASDWQDCVHLMTLHSAKGLEFPLVFLAGMEEGLFPHHLSCEDPAKLEEERRLCYVGMTRAKSRLFLTHAEARRLHGADFYPVASRFIREIPAQLIEEVRMRADVSRPVFRREAQRAGDSGGADNGDFRLGQRVEHPKFGEGVVLMYEGQGSHARVQVNFENAGAKWLVVAYANLQTV
ncbi:MAG: DNA helicase II [Gammaproteobacteria bacterium]|nr:DNA helicase II [Gammaproteobacteria bacterium]NIM74651.1 DNA helicase II [Gammaproteobacteria bacterium]NIO26484.1 DNA helicase II [Gammaproteobacteria bacterium]NIO67036.1 DNA helicase II [Gammaproteobacteria bacterium]NIP66245.1 DNA helicase II [Gammaproteobacteria bacterium]